jgi:NAD(P)-dependent dehydrogenase (short-subunit alcohol dehydrogenase family)
VSDVFDLSGTVVLVGGGAGLIGEALSRGFSEQDATVIVGDTDEERGRELADELRGDASFRRIDVTTEASVTDTIDSIVSEYGRLDVLVNCSYPRNENYGQPYEEMTVADWRENLDWHLTGYYLPAYHASLAMRDQPDGGSIVNFGSTYGMQAPDFTVYEDTEMTSPVEYAAIKGGILNLTRYMASYLGEHDVRVNAISPGGVFDDQDPRFVERYERRTPLGRMADPEDLVGAAVYLASDAAAYVTGHNLVVDGGWTIR